MDPRAQAAAKIDEAAAIRDTAKSAKRAMSADESAKVDALLNDADALNAKADAQDADAEQAAQDARIEAGRKAATATRGRKTAQPGILPAHAVTKVRLSVEDDPKRGYGTGHSDEKPFDGLGKYARDVAASAVPHGHPLKSVVGETSDTFRVLAAMTQGSKIDGGVFTPPAFSTSVWDGARLKSDSLLQYCDVFPMDGSTESITFPAVAETSRANASRWGGVEGKWKTETGTMTDTSGKFRETKFEPQELYLYTKVSDKLLRNAAALNSRLGMMASDELNFKVGDSIINGTGTGMPKGVLAGTAGTDACRIVVAKETGQAANTIVAANIHKMYSRCLAAWRTGAVWFINQDIEPQLEQLAADVGTGGVPIYLPQGGIADTPNARLKGRPVVAIEYAATLGTVGDIMLLNLGAYGVAYRGLVDSAVSMHLYFDTAHTAFRWIVEVDGQPWMKDALTPFKGTNTLSPFTVLATRA